MVNTFTGSSMRSSARMTSPAFAAANSAGALAVPCTSGGGSSGDDIVTPPLKCDTGRGDYVVPHISRSLRSHDALGGTTRRSESGAGTSQTSTKVDCLGSLAHAAHLAWEAVHPAPPSRRKNGVDRGPRGKDSVGLPKGDTSAGAGGRP